MKNETCHNNEVLLDAYYDGELSPEEAREYKSHLDQCPECAQTLRDYSSISGSLAELSRELQSGEGISLWPMISSRLEREHSVRRTKPVTRRMFLLRRPAWMGLALSAAAALILFFSGAFQSEKLPSNFCQIENISSPEHNYMIYQDKSDGLTIIWIME